MNIKGLANFNDELLSCIGEIEIHWIKPPQAYVTWRLFSNEKLIASKSERYFFRDGVDTEGSLINKVIKKIEGYRIGRKRIFKGIEISS